jgi:hypothetical protein
MNDFDNGLLCSTLARRLEEKRPGERRKGRIEMVSLGVETQWEEKYGGTSGYAGGFFQGSNDVINAGTSPVQVPYMHT